MSDQLNGQLRPVVGVIMGSSSDWDVMKNAVDVLKQFGVPFRQTA